MELVLTPEQKKYLDKKGVISADSLQRAYRKSVEEQQVLINQAQKIRRVAGRDNASIDSSTHPS